MDMGGMDMGHGGGNSMDHGGGGGGNQMSMSYTHMTFFWGKNSEILFKGWPGSRGGMYALALAAVFVLAFLVEWLSHCRLTRPGWPRAAAGVVLRINLPDHPLRASRPPSNRLKAERAEM